MGRRPGIRSKFGGREASESAGRATSEDGVVSETANDGSADHGAAAEEDNEVLPAHTDAPQHPYTLAIDIGGTGLKASVLDATGAMVADRVKVPTTYPMGPEGDGGLVP